MKRPLIDFDGLFEEKLAAYVKKDPARYTAEGWESAIPKLYKKFGDTFIAAANNTPKGYYAQMSVAELAEMLSRHYAEGVPVPDFLLRALEARAATSDLLPLLSSQDPDLIETAVSLIGGDPAAFPSYFSLLERENAPAELLFEQFSAHPDDAKAGALALYRAGLFREPVLELLSRCQRDDEVYSVLLKEFLTSGEEGACAAYLATYGDERALEALYAFIDRDDIGFLEFREVKYAIEALGGEYTRPRDFSNDARYLELLGKQAEAEQKQEQDKG